MQRSGIDTIKYHTWLRIPIKTPRFKSTFSSRWATWTTWYGLSIIACVSVQWVMICHKMVDLLYFGSVLCLLCLCVRLFICALWSPAGKGLTFSLSFVVSNCEFVTFPSVSWVRCGTWSPFAFGRYNDTSDFQLLAFKEWYLIWIEDKHLDLIVRCLNRRKTIKKFGSYRYLTFPVSAFLCSRQPTFFQTVFTCALCSLMLRYLCLLCNVLRALWWHKKILILLFVWIKWQITSKIKDVT